MFTSVQNLLMDCYSLLMKTLSPEYITGLCEGEASFTYSLDKFGARPRFGLSLTYTDEALVEKVRDFFGVGNIYQRRAQRAGRRCGESAPSVYYVAINPKDVDRIVEHFNNYPLVGKKSASFHDWKLLVVARKAKASLDEQHACAKAISSHTTKGRPALR